MPAKKVKKLAPRPAPADEKPEPAVAPAPDAEPAAVARNQGCPASRPCSEEGRSDAKAKAEVKSDGKTRPR